MDGTYASVSASTTAISASGMRDAAQRLRSAAHNLANLQTEGFRPEEVISSTVQGGGVTTSTQSSETEGVSIEAELVSQLQARSAYLANLSAFKAAARGQGRIVDLYA